MYFSIADLGILKPPVDATAYEGDNVTFDCFGTGEPTPQVTWSFNGVQINATPGSRYTFAAFQVKGFAALQLTISDLIVDDHGIYSCNIFNGIRFISVSAVLQVQGI